MRDEDQTAAEQGRQYLSFTIASTDYAAPILTVREILQYEEVTRVPGTPAAIRGVLNVRGAVVPVVDLGVKFGRPEIVPTPRTCVLVVEVKVEGAPLTVGIIADAVNEVVDLREDDIEPPPSFGAGVRVDHLLGVGKVGTRFVLLLDLDRVLSATEAELAAQAASMAPAPAPASPPPAEAVG
jgi:chemotaxis signal transduction protein